VTLRVRPPAPADAAAVAAIGNAFEEALAGEDADVWSEAEVVREWGTVADLARDAWLLERGGTPVGFATLRDDGGGVYEADGYVHPGHTGRGVGARILALTEARAAELAGASAEGRAVVRNAVLYADAAARALLEAHGYRPVRSFLRMRIDLDGPPPRPRWPEGIVVRPFRPGIDDGEVHACLEETFAREWTHTSETLDAWRKRKLSDPRFDPGLWLVARDGGEVCGIALCTAGQFEVGFVNTLGVRAPWRRRGLGLALLHAAFGLFWEQGERRVALGVDAENPTDAKRLYERAGMRAAWRADVYEKALRGKRGPIPAAGHRPAWMVDRRAARGPHSRLR
jgi:mycothiol synthase